MTNVRWTVVALLFFAVTINYVDRAVIGVLKPVLDTALGWDQSDYGWMVTAFQAAYALGYVASGPLLDRFGVRLGFSVAVAVWSVAAMAHAAVTSVAGFSVARAVLGLAEGGMFPGRHQGGDRVVSERAARVCDRPLQRGQQRRRRRLPCRRAVARGALGLAGGVRGDGRARLRVGGVLGAAVSCARQAPARVAGGVGLHSQGPAGSRVGGAVGRRCSAAGRRGRSCSA